MIEKISGRVAYAVISFSGFLGIGTEEVSYRTSRSWPSRKSVVLVVEDENLIRLIALDMVEEAGFEAIAASDADEAIRILESRNDIRAVFTDVHMPGSMDGLRLARVVRNRWPPVALIVTSGRRSVLETALPHAGDFWTSHMNQRRSRPLFGNLSVDLR